MSLETFVTNGSSAHPEKLPFWQPYGTKVRFRRTALRIRSYSGCLAAARVKRTTTAFSYWVAPVGGTI